MFKGKKTSLFWVGLIVLIMAIYMLFSSVRDLLSTYISYQYYLSYVSRNSLTDAGFYPSIILWEIVPSIVVCSILVVIGLYLMKIGVKKEAIINNEVSHTV